MEKWPLKSLESRFFKKAMLLHIKLTGLSDETVGSKIRRAIFRNSSVPVKKSHLSRFSLKFMSERVGSDAERL